MGALLAIDRNDLTIGATRAARTAFGLDSTSLDSASLDSTSLDSASLDSASLDSTSLARPLPADMILGSAGDDCESLDQAERGVPQRALARVA